MTDSKVKFDLGAINAKPLPEGVQIKEPRQQGTSSGSGSWGQSAANKYHAKGGFTFYLLKTAVSAVQDPKANDKPCYTITKFNEDLEKESGPYALNYLPSQNGGYYDCSCPASKFDCRHKFIMKAIIDAGHVDSTKFYCFEIKTFKTAEEIR